MTDLQALKNEIRELKHLLDAFKALNSNLDIDIALQNILMQMVTVVKAEAGTLWVVNRETDVIEARAVHGPTSTAILTVKMKKEEGIVGKVIASGESHFIEDVTKDSAWSKRVDASSGFISRSMITVPLIIKDEAIGALQLLNKMSGALFSEDDRQLALTLASQSALALKNSQMFYDLSRMYLSMIRTLAQVLDARDPYTAGHSERVARYSSWIAERLGFTFEECEELYKAALLHDIGKIGIPDAILRKPEKLTNEEFALIKKHPEIGADILSNMEPKALMKDAVNIAKHHHERMDGSGYPEQLKGESIPFLARIVAVADTFDAMTTVRTYSNGLSYKDGAMELIRCKHSLFDGQVVDAFLSVLEDIDYDPSKKFPFIDKELSPFESI